MNKLKQLLERRRAIKKAAAANKDAPVSKPEVLEKVDAEIKLEIKDMEKRADKKIVKKKKKKNK